MEVGTLDIAIICGAIVAVGYGLDKLLLDRQKNWLKSKLTEYWVYVEDLKVSDLPGDIAGQLVRTVRKILAPGELSKISVILRISLGSFVLTLSCLLLPYFIHFFAVEYFFEDLIHREISKNPPSGEEEIAVLVGGNTWEIIYYQLRALKLYLLLPLNALFDVASVFITYKLAKKFIESRAIFRRVAIVTLDMLAAFSLAFACYLLCLFVIFDVWNLLALDPFEGFRKSIGISPVWTAIDRNTGAPMSFEEGVEQDLVIAALFSVQTIGSILFYSATALIPTTIYWIMLVIGCLSVVVLRTIRRLALQIMALSIETEKSIFFYTSATVAVIVAGVKLFHSILGIY